MRVDPGGLNAYINRQGAGTMRQPRRAEAEIPKARFVGALWTVAMSENDWQVFCAAPSDAIDRLSAVFEHFCEYGGDNLPGTTLRWLTPTANDPASENQGAFEAKGVVVRGRWLPSAVGGTFIVKQIVVDRHPPVPPLRGRRVRDDRQGVLALGPVNF